MTGEPDVRAVNLDLRKVMLDDGELANITNLLDADGDETDDPELAEAAVFQYPSGRWGSLDLSQFRSGETLKLS